MAELAQHKQETEVKNLSEVTQLEGSIADMAQISSRKNQ